MYIHQCYICDGDVESNIEDPYIVEIICNKCIDEEIKDLEERI